MPTNDNALNLSPLQQQTLDDLGVDAWFLTPLAHPETVENQQYTAIIDGLVDSLTQPTDSIANTTPSPASPPVSNKLSAIPSNPKESEKQGSATNTTVAADPPSHQTTVHSTQKIPANARRQHIVPTVLLDAERNIAPPAQRDLAFPDVSTISGDWQIIRESAIALAAAEQLPYVLGIGDQHADNVLVFPPPDYPVRQRRSADDNATTVGEKPLLNDAEQQLLREMLASVDIDLAKSYSTPLLKHPMRYGLDPDAPALAAQLPILAAELALTRPKRLWLFGAVACQTLLQTAAPIADLMCKEYTISYLDSENTARRAAIICLPALDYLLALPSEKAGVWQRIKSLKVVG